MLSRFHLIPERHGQTDGQNCYINIACRKIEHSKIVTPVIFNLQRGTRDYITYVTHHATFGSNRFSGASPQQVTCNTFVTFDCVSILTLDIHIANLSVRPLRSGIV